MSKGGGYLQCWLAALLQLASLQYKKINEEDAPQLEALNKTNMKVCLSENIKFLKEILPNMNPNKK